MGPGEIFFYILPLKAVLSGLKFIKWGLKSPYVGWLAVGTSGAKRKQIADWQKNVEGIKWWAVDEEHFEVY